MQLLPDPPGHVLRSGQKSRLLPAVDEVMSAEIASCDFGQLEGAIAQLGERLLCKQEVAGSIPAGSTSFPAPPAQRAMTRAHADQHRWFFLMCSRDRADEAGSAGDAESASSAL